jgi:peptidoglycan/xylan/chitin deacetylase (PgdA/CDA1 family)
MLPTYHEIVPTPAAYVYSATSAEFTEQLQMIRMREPGRQKQVVTFDDGHLSQYIHGLPVLERQGLKAIFFVTAGWTGRRSTYMGWEHLRELVSLGHEVQSHGWSHEILTRCASKKVIEELRRSKESLEDQLGVGIDAISMPGGRWNQAVLRYCEHAGYTKVYTSDAYARPTLCGNVSVLGRCMIRRGMSGSDVIRLLESRDAMFSIERTLFHLKRSVRAILGDTVYHRIWRWAGRSDNPTLSSDGPHEAIDEHRSTN